MLVVWAWRCVNYRSALRSFGNAKVIQKQYIGKSLGKVLPICTKIFDYLYEDEDEDEDENEK